MTREETKRILMVIDATYTTFKVDNLSDVLDAWHFFLADHDYNEIAIALKTYVNTSGSTFAPSVSQLIAMTRKTEELGTMTELEAWSLVSKAICNSIYHAQEEFDKLPALAQKAVGSPEQLTSWAMGDDASLETVIASNFQRSYRAIIQREQTIRALPIEARQKLENLQRLAIGEKA